MGAAIQRVFKPSWKHPRVQQVRKYLPIRRNMRLTASRRIVTLTNPTNSRPIASAPQGDGAPGCNLKRGDVAYWNGRRYRVIDSGTDELSVNPFSGETPDIYPQLIVGLQ